MGLSMVVQENERLPMLNTIWIPEPVSDLRVRQRLLEGFGIEIGGGLGEFSGKVWRVGLMGHSCTKRNVFLFLSALESVLKEERFNPYPGAVEAAAAVYGKSAI
jgi:alanine-glyoxylate transaminase/serine-glyoxylate transaminase/serine-pyruvate transaminase